MASDGLNGRTCDSEKPVNFGACTKVGTKLVKECCPKSCCLANKGEICKNPYEKAENVCNMVAAEMNMKKALTSKRMKKGRIGAMWKGFCEKSGVADENFESVAIQLGKVVKVDDKGKMTTVEAASSSTFTLPGTMYNYGNGCTLMCGKKTSDEMVAENNGTFDCPGKRACVFLKPELPIAAPQEPAAQSVAPAPIRTPHEDDSETLKFAATQLADAVSKAKKPALSSVEIGATLSTSCALPAQLAICSKVGVKDKLACRDRCCLDACKFFANRYPSCVNRCVRL